VLNAERGILRNRNDDVLCACRDNEVVGPVPLPLDWEVLSVMVASVSVDQYEDFRAPLRRARELAFLPLPRNGLLRSSEGLRVTSQLYRLEGDRIKRLKEEWRPLLNEMAHLAREGSYQGPQEYDRVSSAPVARGRRLDGAFR
jgi:hypothetical protein